MGIQWVHLNVPMHRRLELLTSAFSMFVILALGPLSVLLTLYLLVSQSINNNNRMIGTDYYATMNCFKKFDFSSLGICLLRQLFCCISLSFIMIEIPAIPVEGELGKNDHTDEI